MARHTGACGLRCRRHFADRNLALFIARLGTLGKRWQCLAAVNAILMATAQHAFTHIVLKRQRAHGQLLYVLLHRMLSQLFRGLDCGLLCPGLALLRLLVAGLHMLQRTLRSLRAGFLAQAAAFFCGATIQGVLQRRAAWQTCIHILQGFFGRGHDFHAARGLTVGENQRAIAKDHARLGQSLTGGRGVKAFDIHAVAPLRIGPMRMVCVSGISLCESTCRRGATRRSSLASELRIASGTSRQAGRPSSSC